MGPLLVWGAFKVTNFHSKCEPSDLELTKSLYTSLLRGISPDTYMLGKEVKLERAGSAVKILINSRKEERFNSVEPCIHSARVYSIMHSFAH